MKLKIPSEIRKNGTSLDAILDAPNRILDFRKNKDLICSDLRFCDLSKTNLQAFDFSHASLSYSDFTGANLKYSNFNFTSVEHAVFRGSQLEFVTIKNTDISTCDFNGCLIDKSNVTNIWTGIWESIFIRDPKNKYEVSCLTRSNYK